MKTLERELLDMEATRNAIELAILHGAQAAKLRAFVKRNRQDENDLKGLERLAVRMTELASAALAKAVEGTALGEPAAPSAAPEGRRVPL